MPGEITKAGRMEMMEEAPVPAPVPGSYHERRGLAMETDSFFCQLLKQLPETLFELLGLPGERAKSYRFDSVEVKKSFRIDGLFIPRRTNLPLYFVEVQFRREQRFYANLFAEVFCYLEENNPSQEWVAVAIFPSRAAEPVHLKP